MKRVFTFIILLLHITLAHGQCVNAFPYNEGFESGAGGWVSGGNVSPDWALGAPSKPVISSAGGGTQCWIIGGLTSSSYSSGERSYVQSPCFDFTGLQHPYISLKVFWESEKKYDGSNLQYSTNAGSSWINVGAFGDAADCMTANWYNTDIITNLQTLVNVPQGWAGNIQATQGSCQGGNGSNGWVVAKHCIAELAGQPSVMFRFTFGAGTACNNFDGIAFDDINISEAPAITADFTYRCNSTTSKAMDFTATTTLCPDTLLWDFGDGTTGTGITTPHIYSTGGTYNVTFYAASPCNAGVTVSKQVSVLNAVAMADPSSCNSQNGKAFVTATPSGSYTYSWNSSPVQTTDTAFNLVPSVYSVTVSGAGGCFATTSIAVTSVNGLAVALTPVNTACDSATGTVTAAVTTGTSPFAYAWNNGGNTQTITGVGVGSYTVSVSDATGCSTASSAVVGYATDLAVQFNPVENESCFGKEDGKIVAVTTGGKQPVIYQWSTGANTAAINSLVAATYFITVVDAANCSVNDSVVLIKEHCNSYAYFPTGFSPNGDGTNDVFRCKYSIDLQKFHMRVYNRWGELVFETSDVLDGWDGTFKNIPQPISTFVWYAEYSFTDGKAHQQAGNITLMR